MEEVSTVSQVNMYIKNMFVRDYALRQLRVKGEISNCKYHSSGHIYFTIKDQSSQLSCVMFATYTRGLAFRMKEGQSVIVSGNISVYERDGKYQMYAMSVTQDGVGKLYEEYEKLKKRLLAEGLFDDSKKKKIPRFAQKIGVVTAQTGAVIQDIRNVSNRRNPYVQIILYPAKVQGKDAHQTIIKGLQYFEKTDVDIVIIGRGGGSIEDLWEFNQEELAYAIAACTKPVISAVGHETDFSISDFVADLRAPTPSAAAELAVPDIYELKQKINTYQNRLKISLTKKVEIMKLRYEKCMSSFVFKEPTRRINENYIKLDSYIKQLENLINTKNEKEKKRYVELVAKLDTLSPLKTLMRGYSIAEKEGKIVKSIEELKKDDNIDIRLTDGKVQAKII